MLVGLEPPVTPTRKQIQGTLVACAALAVAAMFAGPRLAHEMTDFGVYWTAALRAADAEPLYRVDDGHYQFKYLPAFAVLAAPLAAMPLATAKTAWFVFSAALLPVLVSVALALVPDRRKPAWFLVTFTAAVMAKFYGHELVLGQVNILFAVVVAAALLGLRGGREAVAGSLIVVAIVIKPYAVLFLPWLLTRRRRASIIAAVFGIGAVLILPVLAYGPSGAVEQHVDWWRTVTDSTAPNLTNNDNVSLAAFFAKWLGAGPLAGALAAMAGVTLLGLAVVVYLRRGNVPFPEGLEGAMLLTCIPLLSPQGWDYVFLVSTPAVLFLFNYGDVLPRGLRLTTYAALALIGLTLYDVMGRAAYGRFMEWSIITICYGVVIWSLVALRLRQVV
jgi:arabinofuranan 3-O-arabinosyltransferase